MEDQNPAENEQAQPKSGSKKWLLIAVGLVVLLGGGGGAAYFLGFSAEAEEATEETTAEGLNEINDIFQLEPLVVNLADEDDIRYARIGVSLGLVSAKPGEAIIEERLLIPKLRDRFLVLVGQKTSTELVSLEVKEALKKDIADFINRSLDPALGRVAEVYFTEFIIQ
jgi:flagellar FliL protein